MSTIDLISSTELTEDTSSAVTEKVNPVVSHYNNKKETGLDQRTESRIFYLRNFNNWIKSVLIKEHVVKLNREKANKSLSVIDLGCGRGGDIKKWMKSRNVDYVLFTDIAEISLNECKERYKQSKPRFKADFLHMDLTTELIIDKFDQKFDLISCQFVLHYSFESFEKSINFIKNVSNSLNVGGYFIGTTTDSFEIVKRLSESGTNTFGNDVYKVKYLNEEGFENQPPLFGAKIAFQLDGVVDCPEYLIHFPTLVRIALKYNLRLVFKKRFSDFFNEYSKVPEYETLLQIMKAIEPYSNEDSEKNLKSKNLSDYEHVREKLSADDNRTELGTLSKSEWEAATLYICFGFEKF
jgi:mRNA (guanine-N7-)-methyltransferase